MGVWRAETMARPEAFSLLIECLHGALEPGVTRRVDINRGLHPGTQQARV